MLFNVCFISIKRKQKNKTEIERWNILGLPVFKTKIKTFGAIKRKTYYLLGIKYFQKKIFIKINLKHVTQHKAVVSNLQNELIKRKIRVCFLVSETAKWNMQHIYDLMEKSSVFEPFILVTRLKNTEGHQDYKHICQFFKKLCKKIEVGFDVEKNQSIDIKRFSPDIVFYQQPWEIWDNQRVDYVSNFALPYYV